MEPIVFVGFVTVRVFVWVSVGGGNKLLFGVAGVVMDKADFQSFLKVLPPVEFCCVYGSALHPNNVDKSTVVDYILGVSNPEQWHSQNLKMNKNHYASWLAHLGGAKLITEIADEIGVGVHFNPFVSWNNKDIINWERFYLSGRLQKPVCILVDNLDIEKVNSANLRAAISASLLLLPPKFTEEDLYAKICGLSYTGNLRMLFAEDRNKVKKIVQGQFGLFQSRYKPFLEEYESKELLRLTSSGTHQTHISQDCSLSLARSLVNSLPPNIRSQMGMKLGEKKRLSEFGRIIHEVSIGSREEAANCMRKVLQRKVMVSSARQAVSGVVTVGGVKAAKYLANKMCKAWKSLR
ncbi:hypothetical protein CJ030_MR2G027153 [Morella rubra]|uniref:Phosphatidate cytidylyltransferase, mitochondrial n=1 Tax=Morella rubra TaxID=262757 RepID=A0A6A1W8C0_9ROSI|nr:hypothetical protein CJ030_MR2G027153 [Morella rubra]